MRVPPARARRGDSAEQELRAPGRSEANCAPLGGDGEAQRSLEMVAAGCPEAKMQFAPGRSQANCAPLGGDGEAQRSLGGDNTYIGMFMMS